MLHAIVPLLSTPELRQDLHLVNPLFEQLRLNTLEFLIQVKELSPSDKWMEKCKSSFIIYRNDSAKKTLLYSKSSAFIAIRFEITEYTALPVAGLPVLCISSCQRIEFQSIVLPENANEGNVLCHVYRMLPD